MRVTIKIGSLIALLLVCLMATSTFAQATGAGNGGGPGAGGGGGGGGNGGGGGRGNRAQRMMDTLKQQLGATDDEFAVLQPKIQKVMTTQQEAGNGGGMRGLFGGGRRGQNGQGGQNGGGAQGGNPPGPQTAVQQAQSDLRTTLANQSATAEEIKAKIDTLRQARAKAREDLTSAQTDLKSVLTQRQEAIMILAGLLD
ncbi:MAG: hypothetical protein M3O30_14420 [Planctomycetota bacterium]|nr:hypothetical protein [Planctomycetota bacterium]